MSNFSEAFQTKLLQKKELLLQNISEGNQQRGSAVENTEQQSNTPFQLKKKFLFKMRYTNLDDSHQDSPQTKTDLKDSLQIKEQQRKTDGYFNAERAQKEKNKIKKKKHIFSRRATYLPKADKQRLTLGISDEYRHYSLAYIDHGYGALINLFSWGCSIYMAGFSFIMRKLGGVVDQLEEKYGSNNVGYGMMILSNTLYLVPTIFIKCNPQIDFSLAVMTRGFIAIFLIFQMAHVKKQELTRFPNQDLKYLVYRGVFTAVSQLYFFFALGKLPLSINMIISNTGPIFVFIMSVFFFDGLIHRKDVFGICLAVFGVFCVSNPDYVTSLFVKNQSTTIQAKQVQGYQYAEGLEKVIYIIIFLVVYVGWSYGVLVVKQLKYANTLAMNFFVAVSFFLVGAITMLYRPSSIFNLSYLDIFNLIFVIGLFAFGSQYTFITSTFLNHNHGPLTMLGYLSVVKSYIIQIIFFGEVPSCAEIIGSLFVLLGVAKILIH